MSAAPRLAGRRSDRQRGNEEREDDEGDQEERAVTGDREDGDRDGDAEDGGREQGEQAGGDDGAALAAGDATEDGRQRGRVVETTGTEVRERARGGEVVAVV